MSSVDKTSRRRFDNLRGGRGNIARVVVPGSAIARRVAELAEEISACYDGREITILAVLTGSLVFLADLMRRLTMPLRIGVVSVSSYVGRAATAEAPRITIPLDGDLSGRDVLILDDILDSGRTLRALCDLVEKQNVASLKTCVLLRKNRPDLSDRPAVDFVGFGVGDEFVVGYGLDYDNLYRNLPDVCVLKGFADGVAGRCGREEVQ